MNEPAPTEGRVPTEPSVARVPVTGHPRVDEAMAMLARVQDGPPAEQVGPLAEVHRALRETLDTIGDV